jgi:hypothetical protein
MEDNLDNNTVIQLKIIKLIKNNKSTIIYLAIFLIIASISAAFFLIKNKNKNNLVAEKYVQAGLYLSAKENEKSTIIYEEIINSKNKFYSILALNEILEKNLISDKNKILSLFKIVEETNDTNEQKDIITFKKALYLIKTNETKKGENLLKNLIDKNSKIKSLAEEIITK